MSKKTIKKIKKIINLGAIKKERLRILLPLLAINIFLTGTVFATLFHKKPEIQIQETVQVKKINPLEGEIREMVKGYPIEEMVPYIATQDKNVAAFIVAIAKKESAWGNRRPVLNGENCYNYWGFRLKAERMGSGGHTCFDNPQQAVNVIANRIDKLVNEEKIDTPSDMVIWKCGYDCQDRVKNESEKKWIKDVAMYYKKIDQM